MRFIKNLIKFCIALFISSILIVLTFIFIFKDQIYETIRIETSKKFSEISGVHVNIGRLAYSPPYSLSLSYITISEEEASVPVTQAIENITLTPDIHSLLTRKELKLSMDVDNFHYKNLLLAGIIRIKTDPVTTYKDLINIKDIKSISILTADMYFDGFLLKNIFGTLGLKNMRLETGKLHIPYEKMNYLLEFNKIPEKADFSFTLNSKNIGTKGRVSFENKNDLHISELEGMLYTFRFDTDLTIKDFYLPERTFLLKGKVETDLDSLSFLPGNPGIFFRKNRLTGKFFSEVDASFKDFSMGSIDLVSNITVENLSAYKIFVKDISTSLSLTDGKISTSGLTADLYNGTANCSFELDLLSGHYPFFLSAEIRDIDYKSLLTDISEKRPSVDGKIFANITLDGSLKNLLTYKGSGNIAIINADLGKMPILTPLLGDMYSSFQGLLPGIKVTNIHEVSADLSISNRKIHTDNLIFLGDDITINGYGYMDFNGNLDFDFEHRILEPEYEEEDWQITLRNVIINLGKLVKKTHLSGTIKNPKWGLE